MAPQRISFLAGELEHEIFGEAIEVAFDCTVECLGFDAVQKGQIRIEHHLVLADGDYEGSDGAFFRHKMVE